MSLPQLIAMTYNVRRFERPPPEISRLDGRRVCTCLSTDARARAHLLYAYIYHDLGNHESPKKNTVQFSTVQKTKDQESVSRSRRHAHHQISRRSGCSDPAVLEEGVEIDSPVSIFADDGRCEASQCYKDQDQLAGTPRLTANLKDHVQRW